MRVRCLVTGGAGFIGSVLAERLVAEGRYVEIVDDLSAGEKAFVHPGVARRHYCDTTAKSVLSQIEKQSYDYIFHLAACPRVEMSVSNPYDTNETNVSKTVRLLEAARGNLHRFVLISSCAVYGDASALPTIESTPHNPQSPYGLQKSVCEAYCRMFSKMYGLDTVAIRPFNVYGRNQKGDSPYATALAKWFHAVKHGRPLRSDGDGTQSRDLVYVEDVAALATAMMGYPGRFDGEAFNCGSEVSYTNNEVLAMFKAFYECTIVNAPPRKGDVKMTLASTGKARTWLGWKPTVMLEDGFRMTAEWTASSPLF